MHIRSVTFCSLLLSMLCALALVCRPVAAQGGPPPEMRRVVDATVSVLNQSDRESIKAFASEFLSPAYRQSMSEAALLQHIEALRTAVRPNSGGLGVEGEPGGAVLQFGGDSGPKVRLQVGPATQWRIADLHLLAGEAPATAAAPGGDPREDAIMRHAKAIERIGLLSADAALTALESGHLAPSLFSGIEREALLTDLAGLRQVIASAGMINLQQRGEDIVMQFRGGKPGDVLFAVAAAPPFEITRFEVELTPTLAPPEPAAALSWEQLESRLRTAEREGFSGVVIAQRGGQTTLSQSYGFADRDEQRALTVDSVFDIGSMPIDFTRAAILWLQQEGRISLDDTLEKYFADVPQDKRGIRLAQLMDGSSGLANFHHRDGDVDKDLSFVDRDRAMSRIFERPLLFAPGEGNSHSHSAFGLLAMVVETVSGEPYANFLRRHLFTPAGMSRTGYYGEMLGLERPDFAIGYGQPASSPNIPPLWGPVSWLVIGSGGMVSSVADMQRGYNYLLSGKWLRGDSLLEYQRLRVGVGGSDRGFFFLRVGGDNGDALFLASNSAKGPAANEQLVQSLIRMVLPQRATANGL